MIELQRLVGAVIVVDPFVFRGTRAIAGVLARSYGWVDDRVARAAEDVVLAVRWWSH